MHGEERQGILNTINFNIYMYARQEIHVKR